MDVWPAGAPCYLVGMADRAQFLNELCDLVEVERGALKGSEELAALEAWNSLAVLGVIAWADENNGVTLAPANILECRTVDDLAALVQGSRG